MKLTNDDGEEFFRVPGYPNYWVSKSGKVCSLKPSGLSLRKYIINHSGYPFMNLWKHGKYKGLTVHRIVALTFLPRPSARHEVNHKNGIKTDCRLENLEWVTKSENIKHAFGVLKRKCSTHFAKLSEEQVRKVRAAYNNPNESYRTVAKKFNISDSQVFRIVNRLQWKHIE